MLRTHVFTYGSLMFAELWQAVVRRPYRSCRATITGYHRCRIRGDSYPVITRTEAAAPLEGVVYFNVRPSDLARLDCFEGLLYERRNVTALTAKGAVVSQAYCLRAHHKHLASSVVWSPERFRRYQLARFRRLYCAAAPAPKAVYTQKKSSVAKPHAAYASFAIAPKRKPHC